MSALSLAVEILGRDLTGGAFASVLAKLGALDALASGADSSGLDSIGLSLQTIEGAALGAAAAFVAFSEGLKTAVEGAAQLEMAGTMASIAISDGSQHVSELEAAIVALANNSQYKIADVDMAFRVLGGLGFDTAQILGGLGEQAIVLAQAMGGPGAGVSAADAAQLLGQAIYIFGNRGLTAAQAADVLTGAFYNNMMSVSDLTQFLGMAGGTAASLGVSFNQLMTFGSMLTPMFGSASSAGASLSYMMRNLAAPSTSKIADEIQKLGLHIYDAQGNFVGLKSIMDQLFTDMSGMTDQQKMDVFSTLFNVRSGRAAMDLMSQTQQSFDQEYSRINSRLTQTGQAQKDSTAINNTTQGSWQRLTTTVHDFFAMVGLGLLQDLKPLIDHLNSLFTSLQQDPTKTKFFLGMLVFGTVASGVALAVLGIVAAVSFFGPIVGAAAVVFGGLVYLVSIAAGLFVALSTKADIFTGKLAVLNPIVDFFRSVWELMVTIWQYQVIPLWNNLSPLAQKLALVLLALVGVILFSLIFALFAVALAIEALIVLILGLIGVIQWLVTHASDLWNQFQALVQFYTMLVSMHLLALWTNFQNFFTNLGNNLHQWGIDLIQNLIDGMLSKIGGLDGVLGQIAGHIFSFLHHSTPDEGPLRGDDLWGAELVQNFATGMVSAIPTLRSATGQVAGTLSGGLSGVTPSGITPVGGLPSYGSMQGQQVILPIYIGQDLVAEYGYNTMTHQLTMNGMGRQYR